MQNRPFLFNDREKTGTMIKTGRVASALIFLTGLYSITGAQMLVRYGFNDSMGPSAFSGVIAGDLELGPGIAKRHYSAVRSEGAKSLLFNNAGWVANLEKTAVTGDRYIRFMVAPEPGRQMSLQTLSFEVLRRPVEGAAAPDRFAVYASADRYRTAVASGEIVAAGSDSDSLFQNYTLDLSGSALLQSISGETEFRIYMWVSGGAGQDPKQRNFRMDDLKLEGLVLPATTLG